MSREDCTYQFPGMCTNECLAKNFCKWYTNDGSLKGKDGRERVRNMKEEAKERGCPEADEIKETSVPA